MKAALIANIILIALEIISFSFGHGRLWKRMVFYTQLSNMVTLISSVSYVISSDSALTVTLRYLSTVMLTMTVLVTLCVLVPAGAGFVRMMLSGNGLFHHTICPAISITSYILWEQHSSMWLLPVLVTFAYGMVMLYLNYAKLIEGPYPFFRIYDQSKKATVIWMAALTVIITLISLAITFVAK